MNNRQKAKHFKQLYEKTLAQKYYPEVIRIDNIKHCRVSAGFSPDLIINEPDQELISNLVMKKITDQMRPIIKDHVITRFDNIMGVYRVSFDFWVKEAAGVKNDRKQ